MKVLQTNIFKKSVKKLDKKQKINLDQSIRKIIKNPLIGEEKKGDLRGIRVYKFHIYTQLYLLAYQFDSHEIVLILLALGSHENFYRDLKRH